MTATQVGLNVVATTLSTNYATSTVSIKEQWAIRCTKLMTTRRQRRPAIMRLLYIAGEGQWETTTIGGRGDVRIPTPAMKLASWITHLLLHFTPVAKDVGKA